MALLLILVVLYLYYSGYAPDYLSDGLGESVLNASNSISSECRYTNKILKIEKEIDAAFWWVVINSGDQIDYRPLKIASWSLFLLFNSLAILGINRFIAQIVHMIDQIFKRG